MKFFCPPCRVCLQPRFTPEEMLAFRLRNKAIEPVALNGEEPWSGVFCVCVECAKIMRQMLKEKCQ